VVIWTRYRRRRLLAKSKQGNKTRYTKPECIELKERKINSVGGKVFKGGLWMTAEEMGRQQHEHHRSVEWGHTGWTRIAGSVLSKAGTEWQGKTRAMTCHLFNSLGSLRTDL
jgi:hypothetical protein